MVAMKIQGASFTFAVLLSLSSATLVASSSVQVRGSLAKKALVVQPGGDATAAPVPENEEKKEKKESHEDSAKWQFKEIASWSGTSNVNFHVTLIFAALWVLLLGSTPVLVYYFGDKKITNSAMVLSCLMWMALFGGLYLFTQIILFNSPHFDKVRSLTIIECVYFMTQVITTVGYGDITPAMPRGQLFVGVYVTLSFFVIALLMSEMQSMVMNKVSKYKEELEERRNFHSAMSISNESTPSSSPSRNITGFKPEKPSCDSLITACSIFAGVAAVWACFFHLCPGENKLWLEAIYMSLITLTTVGFGAITPTTEAGMLFAAFFMFIGTSALLNVVQNFSTYMLEMDQYEAWDAKAFQKDLKQFRANTSGHAFSEVEFLSFSLIQKNIATQEQIDAIKESYHAMGNEEGIVSIRSIKSFHARAEEQETSDSGTEAASTARSQLASRS